MQCTCGKIAPVNLRNKKTSCRGEIFLATVDFRVGMSFHVTLSAKHLIVPR